MSPVNPTRSPWLLLSYLAAGLLVVAVQAGTLTSIGPLLLNGQLVDGDSYTWLGHVQRLLDTGNWYDHTQPRANWPFGEIQHSTRPLDAILLAGTVALTPFLGREAALFWSGAAVSPLLYLGLAAAVAWTAASLFGRWRGPVAIVVLLAQFAALAYSLPGRADHHTLIMLCFTLAVGLTGGALREPAGRLNAALAGALAGLGVWLSPEFLLALAACFGALALAWIQSGERARSASALLFSAAFGVAIAGALLLEYPLAEILKPRFERISSADFVIALLATAFWLVVRQAETRQAVPMGLRGRLIASALGATVALGGFALAFPGFFAGPLAGIDERARIVLVDVVSETYGLLPRDAQSVRMFLLYLGGTLVAVPAAVAGLRREWRGPLAPVWAFLTLVVGIYAGASLVMLRFAPYAEIAGAIVLSDLLVRLASGTGVATRITAALAGLAVLAASGATAYIAGHSLERLPPCHDPLSRLATFIDREAEGSDRPWTIVAISDLGPELLYRTKHRVIATPSLSNQDGAIAMFTILNASDDRTSRSTIESRGVDHILICQALPFSSPLARDPRLLGRLYRSEPPAWLEQMPLPAAIEATYDLFRVRPELLPKITVDQN
jgi:hypothetical protein